MKSVTLKDCYLEAAKIVGLDMVRVKAAEGMFPGAMDVPLKDPTHRKHVVEVTVKLLRHLNKLTVDQQQGLKDFVDSQTEKYAVKN